MPDVAVVGAGFTGLTAAYELAKRGLQVLVLEADAELGGLAGAFDLGGTRLERFYHHWFTSDRDAMELVEELGLSHRLRASPTHTAVYYANRFHRLSTPLDLLRFGALPLADRLRLGWLTLRARHVRDWRALEDKTAREWLTQLGGENVYRVVWEPLLEGKFGPYADRISAVWLWNKLKLRGGSRGRRGEERLAYLDGGFVALAEALARRIVALGGRIELGTAVHAMAPAGSGWRCRTSAGEFDAGRVLATPALPLVARMIDAWAPRDYVKRLERIEYLANVCLVLTLDRPLSGSYWLNVNDPGFPFVAVIEHTNFQSADAYGGRHVVYLSKYLLPTEPLYAMQAPEMLEYALPHLQRMFPRLRRDWVLEAQVWKARWAQPIVECGYGRLIPGTEGPAPGLHLCSMAQIYPEDRGTNYAIRDGRRIAAEIHAAQARR